MMVLKKIDLVHSQLLLILVSLCLSLYELAGCTFLCSVVTDLVVSIFSHASSIALGMLTWLSWSASFQRGAYTLH